MNSPYFSILTRFGYAIVERGNLQFYVFAFILSLHNQHNFHMQHYRVFYFTFHSLIVFFFNFFLHIIFFCHFIFQLFSSFTIELLLLTFLLFWFNVFSFWMFLMLKLSQNEPVAISKWCSSDIKWTTISRTHSFRHFHMLYVTNSFTIEGCRKDIILLWMLIPFLLFTEAYTWEWRSVVGHS